MINFYGGRGTGKTKRILEYAAKNNITIVCKDPKRMMEKLHGHGITGVRCIDFDEFGYENVKYLNSGEKNTTKYALDSVEDYLEYLDMNIDAFTSITEGE